MISFSYVLEDKDSVCQSVKELPSEKLNAFLGIEFLFSEVNTVNHGHKATENEK